jgi:hypothetical protein
MYLCTYMNEEGDDGEDDFSETSSLSYTLRNVCFTDVDRVCRVPLRKPIHLCTLMLFIIRVK